METEHRKTYLRREPARRSPRSTGARSCSTSSRTTARSSATLGLMDFSDQIALGRPARPASVPRSGAVEREKFKVVLLDEYQDTSVAQALMLSRLFSGPDEAHGLGPPGHRGRRPQPGDLRLAGRLGLQHPRLRRVVPEPPTAAAGPSRSPSTGAPRPRILDRRQPPRRAALRRTARPASRSSRSPTPGPARCAPPCTRPTTTSWPGSPTRWSPPTSAWTSRPGARSAC